MSKKKKPTGKILGNMIKIQEPRRPWEIVHMDWVTGLPPGGDRSYNHQGKSHINRWKSTSHCTACYPPVWHEKTSTPLPGHLTLELAPASLPNPLRCLACLRARTPLQMRLRHCPPISTLTTPYAYTPLPLTIFTLLQCPHHSLRFRTPASSSPQLTILTLLRGPQVMPPMRPSPPPNPICHLPSLCSHGALKICLPHHPQPPLCLILSPPLTILMLRY
ncbi:hypothetical protein O181_029817 [Austropuccinia psidii MF-1]|uniref:Uncharacterized protein n=1 Tax=Austropuccinia psidii MF-1 TaxID=1389203 RepID=A0A9Q3CUJ1_9BASI|nr:hypothetical protein [Austropuccinia psidii MF-1]